eukprot:6932479-Prymnesium_polylepis.1
MPGDQSCSVGAAHSRAVGPRHRAEDVRTSVHQCAPCRARRATVTASERGRDLDIRRFRDRKRSLI